MAVRWSRSKYSGEQRGQRSQREQAFPPIHLHHLIGHGVGFAFVTEFRGVLGLVTGCDSSCYHDDAHDLHHPKQFVNADVAAFACPFPSALACVLFFHDASGPLHYPLKKQKRNDHVYAFCVVLGLDPVTYKSRLMVYFIRTENTHKSRVGAGGDGGQILKVLLTRCCRRLEKQKSIRVSDRRIHKANLPFKIVNPTVHPAVPSIHIFLLMPRGTILRWWVWPSGSVILRW